MGPVAVTLIDAGNPTAFVLALDLGLPDAMTWAEMSDADTLARVEAFRCAVAVASGLSSSEREFRERKPLLPQLSLVGPPIGYRSESHGHRIEAEAADLVARLFVFGTLHRSYPLTGVIATAVAARLPESVVWRCIPEERRSAANVIVGHPCGVTEARVRVFAGPDVRVEEVAVQRTARRLFEGSALVPSADFEDAPTRSPALVTEDGEY
jgi:2-methylaconitate cis-trans-isomerase PrpF